MAGPKMKRVTVLVLLLCPLVLGGCLFRTPYENYPAGSLTEQQVATLELHFVKTIVDDAGNTILDIGERFSAERLEYRLTPGRYQIAFNWWGWPINNNFEGIAELQPGHRYEVKFRECSVFSFDGPCRQHSSKSYMWLEDVGTGEVLIQ